MSNFKRSDREMKAATINGDNWTQQLTDAVNDRNVDTIIVDTEDKKELAQRALLRKGRNALVMVRLDNGRKHL